MAGKAERLIVQGDESKAKEVKPPLISHGDGRHYKKTHTQELGDTIKKNHTQELCLLWTEYPKPNSKEK